MKGIFIAVIVSLLLLLLTGYALIPRKLAVSSATSFGANRDGVYRFLINDSNWQKWWPGKISSVAKGSFQFTYKGIGLQIQKIFYDVIQLKLGDNDFSSTGFLKIVPYSIDSIAVELSTELVSGANPFSRISGYFRAKKIKHTMDDIVLAIREYTGNLKNIYGVLVKKEKVQYQHLLSANRSFSYYPRTADIYAMIDEVRNYINKSGAQEIFSPMLNIKMVDSTNYLVQVAVPVDRELPQEEGIDSKWMMKGGNILEGEVTGGQKQIDEAAKQIEIYIGDYQRTIIAIPFQMLITDRRKEPDSTKWITRIYYPVV
jgi:hypothetical protein